MFEFFDDGVEVLRATLDLENQERAQRGVALCLWQDREYVVWSISRLVNDELWSAENGNYFRWTTEDGKLSAYAQAVECYRKRAIL